MVSDDEDSGPKYAYATQFEYNDLEFLGLIKFDILASVIRSIDTNWLVACIIGLKPNDLVFRFVKARL